jgi:hypothetical protein
MPRILFAGLLLGSLAAQTGPNGTVSTIDGRSLSGAVTIDAEGHARVATATGDPVTLGVDEIASFEAAGTTPKVVTTPHRLWLRSGLELPCVRIAGVAAAEGKPARLAVELPSGATVEVAISTVRAVRHGGDERAEPPSFLADLADPPANGDLLYIQKDGKAQRFTVTVNGMQPSAVEFELRGKAHEFELAGVTAIVFGKNTGFAADRQPRPRTAVDFATGEHLEGRLLELGANLRLRLDEGAVVEVANSQLVRLAVASDRLVWLSDLVPKVEQTPAFDRVWPWTKDRSVAGPGFVIGGKTWGRGLGMVPRTRLVYDLGGNYDLFEATIGIDDRGGPQAHAVFRVLVDDKVAYESPGRTRGMPPEVVRVELGRCQRLAVEVDFGKNYDLGDYCVFADARVLRR